MTVSHLAGWTLFAAEVFFMAAQDGVMPHFLIMSALRTLVENNTVHIIDILFIKKSESGEATINEMDEIGNVDYSLSQMSSNRRGQVCYAWWRERLQSVLQRQQLVK